MAKEEDQRKKKPMVQHGNPCLSWSQLPADLIGESMKYLSSADQIRLRYVCKSWRQLPFRQDGLVHKLPWLVICHLYNSEKYFCELFDPIRKNPHSTFSITRPNLNMSQYYPDYVASKNGWLFLLCGKHGTSHATLLFFCPFTKEKVVLPDLCPSTQNTEKNFSLFRVVTLSSVPKSQDCVYFAFNCYRYEDSAGSRHVRAVISTYRHSNKGWINNEIDWRIPPLCLSAVYYKGDFYCLSRRGNLVVYSVASQKLYLLRLNTKAAILPFVSPPELVVLEGELFLVCLDQHKGHCSLSKFNWSILNWESISHLQNQAIFFRRQPYSGCFAIPAYGDTKAMANKIFYYGSESPPGRRFYDLSDGKSHDCKGTEFEPFFGTHENCGLRIWVEPARHGMRKPQEPVSLLDFISAQWPENLQTICTHAL